MNNTKHPDLDMTREEFIEWTTVGFPIYLENPQDFMVLFADYVNKSENFFTALIEEELDKVYINLDTNALLTVEYKEEEKRVVMLTHITEKNADSGFIGEFKTDLNEYELKKYLGEACIGVIVFCKGIQEVRQESEKFQINTELKKIINDVSDNPLSPEKIIASNKKYDNIWPLK